jgi:cobalt/nickel transport system permease protein
LVWSFWGSVGKRAPASSGDIPLAAATSLLFAATLLPIPVPGLGATSHLCLTPLLGVLLGVRAVLWPTFLVLLLQALFFAHGGITTLGVNALTLGLLGPSVAVVVCAALRRAGVSGAWSLGAACVLGDLSVYLADAGVLALALGGKGAMSGGAVFGAALLGFLPIQGPLALLEGVLSLGLARVLARRKPKLIPAWLGLAASSAACLALCVCSYEGLDATVFGEVATQSGHAPTPSLLDWSEGELGLALNIIILFLAGFLAGQAYERATDKHHGA